MLQQKYKVVLLMASLIGIWGIFPKSVKAQVVQVDGSSTVFPITEAVAEEFQKLKGQGQSHGGYCGDRWRF